MRTAKSEPMVASQEVTAATLAAAQDGVSTGVDRSKGLSVLACILLVAPALFLTIPTFSPLVDSSNRVVDFTGFLAGAKLLGSPKLYDVQANLEVQKELVGTTEPGVIFVRLPFWALAMKPFQQLPYRAALLLWRSLLDAALIAFVIIARPMRYRVLAVIWSVPAECCIQLANDAPLILLFIGLSLACWQRGWRFVSGCFLGMCLGKFHFLIFLPFLMFRRAYRRELKGFLTVAAVVMAINFAVQPDWIRLYWGAMNLPQANMNSMASLMPNFYAVFFWTGYQTVGVVLGVVIVSAILWHLCRNLSFEVAMPLCIFGGLLAAPHTNFVDWTLAIPAMLAVIRSFARLGALACLLLSPIVGALCMPTLELSTKGPVIAVGLSLLLLWGLVRATRRSTSFAIGG